MDANFSNFVLFSPPSVAETMTCVDYWDYQDMGGGGSGGACPGSEVTNATYHYLNELLKP